MKSAPGISDENQIRIQNLPEASMKLVTSMMSFKSESGELVLTKLPVHMFICFGGN